jgi:integrase
MYSASHALQGFATAIYNNYEGKHIKNDSIEIKAIKTNNRTLVPLNSYSTAILKKYASDPRPLPIISNQKSNEHLAKICKLAGIVSTIEIVRKYGNHRDVKIYPKYELVTMHSGRKTFATLSLEADMSADHVMKIGGWKDYKSFKRYINVTDDAVKGAMKSVWG